MKRVFVDKTKDIMQFFKNLEIDMRLKRSKIIDAKLNARRHGIIQVWIYALNSQNFPTRELALNRYEYPGGIGKYITSLNQFIELHYLQHVIQNTYVKRQC